MRNIEKVLNELSHASSRHNAFMKIFAQFQEGLSHFQGAQFPVKGIGLETVSGEKTTITFIGRTYEARFSVCAVDGTLKGNITFCRVTDDGTEQIGSATYNGQSQVDIAPPQGEDPLSLADDSCCMNLVLNWLSDDVYA